MVRTRTARTDLSMAIGLLADLHPGPLPLDPPPRHLVDAALDALYPTGGSDAVRAGVALGVGAGAGWAVRSPMLATYLTAGASTLASETRATGDRLLLGGGRPGEAAATITMVAQSLTTSVVAPVLGGVVGGATGVGAAYALVTASAGRPPAPARRGGVVAPATVLVLAAARPTAARAILTGGRDAARNGARADVAALEAALGLGRQDGATPRSAGAGDVVAAARLVEDVALVLAAALTARAAGRALAGLVLAAAGRR